MKTAFIAVDIQNDFCEGGSLAVTGGTEVARKVHNWLDVHEYDALVATRDNHIDPGAHWAGAEGPDYVDTWPRHCEAGTLGADFRPELGESFSERVTTFTKGEYEAAYSGFEGRGPNGEKLTDWLRQNQITNLEVSGLATDHCVKATVLDALKEGFEVKVLTELCAGVDPERSLEALELMKEAGAEIA